MNALLFIDLPNNWTGQKSQVLSPLFKDGKSLLEFQIEKLKDSQYDLLVSIHLFEKCEALDEVLEVLKKHQVQHQIVESSCSASLRIQSAFDLKSEWKNLIKVVAEDFFSPSPYAQEIYQNLGSEDYTFSVFETLGLNFEIFYKIFFNFSFF